MLTWSDVLGTDDREVELPRETEKQQQDYINKLVDDERARLIERENYLIEQRDKYVEDALIRLNK